MTTKTKDPDATLDYFFDWKPLTHERPGYDSDWLADGETINSYTITVPDGITLEEDVPRAHSQSDGVVTFWLSGGTPGKYIVACKIVTSENRIDERSMIVRVKDR